MLERRTRIVVCLVSVCLGIVSLADAGIFQVKLVALDTSLKVGQETTLQVWGWANDPAAVGTNGITGWMLSLDVPSDQNGVLQVKPNSSNPAWPSVTFGSPQPVDIAADLGAVTFNTSETGDVNELGVYSSGPSSAGLQATGYSLLANVTLQALSPGTAIYSVSGIIEAFLRDGTHFMMAEGSTFVDAANSVNVITVVPEPMTCLLLVIGSHLIVRTRRMP